MFNLTSAYNLQKGTAEVYAIYIYEFLGHEIAPEYIFILTSTLVTLRCARAILFQCYVRVRLLFDIIRKSN